MVFRGAGRCPNKRPNRRRAALARQRPQSLSERAACENPPLCFSTEKAPEMDAERINQIGNQIADLTARTAELRGYL